MKSISKEQVLALLPISDCIDQMSLALRALSNGEVHGPPRQKASLGEKEGTLLVMLASSSQLGAYSAKLVSLHGHNGQRGIPVVQGVVSVFDYETGSVVGLVEASALTYLRTAAMSALATRILSRADAKTHGIFGYGAQAEAHLHAINCVRQIDEVKIWGRQFDKAIEFVEKHKSSTSAKMIAVQSAEEAAYCNILSCATSTTDPILCRKWVQDGAHINLVGSHTSNAREVDSELVVAARVVVDSKEAAAVEAGDLIIPFSEGLASDPASYPELGEVIDSITAGRESPEEITLFKSVGVAAADLYAAKYVVDRAV